jgi:hypothetical protein
LLCQVAFSHPAVDAVNFSALGPPTRVPGLNLLDAAGAPQPVFDALRQLITQTWRTRAQGVVPLDGRVRFRGFHGSYEVKITPVKGTAGHTTLTIAPDQPGEFRLQFNPADGKIEVSSPAAPAKQASR